MTSSAAPRLALGAGLFLLATGGWLGQVEAGFLTDTLPTAAAAGILLLGLIAAHFQGERIARPDLGLAALVLISLLAFHGRQPQGREALHAASAAVAYLAGRSIRLDAVHRRVLLAAVIIPLSYAAWQRWFLFPELAPHLHGEAQSRLLSGRVFSVFILPAQFSAWIAVVLPLALTAAFIGPWRKFARAVSLLHFGAFALAGSLAGPVCALPSLGWFLGRGRAIAAVIALIVAALSVSIATRPETRSLQVSANPILLRLATWSATLDGIREAPVLGHGAASFASLYRERYWRPGADEVRHPHNWPLLLAFEHGILGLGAWLVLAGRLVAPVRDRSARAAAIAFLLATLVDVADASGTLRALGCLFLGASVLDRAKSPGPHGDPPPVAAR